MTNRSFASLTRIAMRQIRSDMTDDSLPYMLLSTVHRLPQFMADYAPGRPARLHQHVIWVHCEMRTCISTASMTSLRRLRFAHNACSETLEIPFITAQFQPVVLLWRRDASPSCGVRSSELGGANVLSER